MNCNELVIDSDIENSRDIGHVKYFLLVPNILIIIAIIKYITILRSNALGNINIISASILCHIIT